MKKLNLVFMALSGVAITTLPLVATQCQKNSKDVEQPKKDQQQNVGGKQNPDKGGVQNPIQGGEKEQPIPEPQPAPKPALVNKDFLALDNDALVKKYIGENKPKLKAELANKKTAWVAEPEDLDQIKFIPSQTEEVSVLEVNMPSDEDRMNHLEDWLKQGKMKVDYRFKVASKADPTVSKEFTYSYEIGEYIDEAKANEIFANSLNLLDKSNYELDRSKLKVYLDDNKYASMNNSYKFKQGVFWNKSVEKAITVKDTGALAKLSFEYNSEAALPILEKSNALQIQPYLYLDEKSYETFFAYKNGKQYLEDDIDKYSITFENMPAKALSAVAIATNYNIQQAAKIDSKKLEALTGKKISEVPTKDMTLDVIKQILTFNPMELRGKADKNGLDKFDFTKDFVKASGMHLVKVTPNEYNGSIKVEFEFNTIINNDPNGTIYLGQGKEQSFDPNEETFKSAKFDITFKGFKVTKTIDKSQFEEKAIFDLNSEMTLANVKESWNAKPDKRKHNGAFQKYDKAKIPFIGFTSLGQGVSNKVFTLKLGSNLNLSDILTTSLKGDNKYLEGSFDEETKELVINFKIRGDEDKIYKQTFTLS
ncbi:hypothetical protein ACX1NB_01965 [Mycoplasma sp. HF14]